MPFSVSQCQKGRCYITGAVRFLVQLDGTPVAARGLLEQTTLVLNHPDHGPAVPGALDVSYQTKGPLCTPKGCGCRIQPALVVGLDTGPIGLFCRVPVPLFVFVASCAHGAFLS